MTDDGYFYTRDTILALLAQASFPERTAEESALIAEFLLAHAVDYDRFAITVRVGQGTPPDPAHLPGVQRQTLRNSKLRIDLLTWIGAQPFIWEVKQRANHHAVGQLFTYRQLWLEDHPDALDPRLGVIARTVDPDLERVFAAHGIDVYLYPAPAGDRRTAVSGVPPADGAAARG